MRGIKQSVRERLFWRIEDLKAENDLVSDADADLMRAAMQEIDRIQPKSQIMTAYEPALSYLWHTLAIGMFYREAEETQPSEFHRWDQQTLATKLHFQDKAKRAVRGAIM